MWTISDVKARGKAAFKANYLNCVVAGFLATLFVGGTAVGGRSSSTAEGTDLSNSLSELTPEEAAIILAAVAGAILFVTAIMLVLKIFLLNPLLVGCYRFFRYNAEDQSTSLSVIKEGFENYGHIFCTLFLKDLFLMLWSLLLFIPGIIKSYSYRMVPFILKDNPELSATEVITRSREMMNGHKWRAFLLDLSFIGWLLLTACTCGIVGIFWTTPYMYSTNAALYLELSRPME